MKPEKHQLVILAAGRPHDGSTPTALVNVLGGMSAARWIIQSSGCSPARTTLVVGHKAREVSAQFPNLKVVRNRDWKHSGSATSLLAAPLVPDTPLIASYGDVLVKPVVMKALRSSQADVTVLVDSSWHERLRRVGITQTRNREKVNVRDGKAEAFGSNLSVTDSTAEFVGVVKFGVRAVGRLLELCSSDSHVESQLTLSDLLQWLHREGFSVDAIDAAENWVEIRKRQDVAKFVLRGKAQSLKNLSGIIQEAEVPPGVSFTIREWSADPDRVIRDLVALFPTQKLAVRSSASAEDSFLGSAAGRYTSVLNISASPEALRRGIEQVVRSFTEFSEGDEVLVQAMVTDVVMSGVMMSRTLTDKAPWIVINYVENNDTEGITSGTSVDHLTMYLSRALVQRGCPPGLDRRIISLLKLCTELEELLGIDFLDIEWAISSDGVVHLLQVRPMAGHAGTYSDEEFSLTLSSAKADWDESIRERQGAYVGDHLFSNMSDWNPAEIIGLAPNRLALSLYRFLVTDGVWAKQRFQFGYRDLRPNPLLESFAGRPYVNTQLSLESFIPSALDETTARKLLDYYSRTLLQSPHLHDKVEFEIVVSCIGPAFTRSRARLRDNAGLSSNELDVLQKALTEITQGAFEVLPRELEKIRALEALQETRGHLENSADKPVRRARELLEECIEFGTLPFAHLARCGFIAMTFLKESVLVGLMTKEEMQDILAAVRTVSHEFLADASSVRLGNLDFTEFAARYGHLRPGTYDITSPTYASQPERFLLSAVHQAPNFDGETPSGYSGNALRLARALRDLGINCSDEELGSFLVNAISAREYGKFVFSRHLSNVLELFAEAGRRRGIDREFLSNLSLEELYKLFETKGEDRSLPTKAVSEANRQKKARELARSIPLPSVITSKSDFDYFLASSVRPNFVGGTEIVGEPCLLSVFSNASGETLNGKIVLIESADPGFDWIFSCQIGGLVTKFGGANSHMAIRCAEFGLPAAIGIGEEKFEALLTASMIRLSPKEGLLSRL